MNNAEHKTQSKEITTLIIHLEKNMISRNWHGYTTKDNADIYESLLQNEIFVGIAKKT